MLNSERQAHIKAALSTAAEPLSASSFARRFTVSRQTIVGDIALLRAQGEPIIATQEAIRYRNQLHLNFWFHVSRPPPKPSRSFN